MDELRVLFLSMALHKDTPCLSILFFPKSCEVQSDSHPPSSLPSGSGHVSYTKLNPHGLSLDGSFISLLLKV